MLELSIRRQDDWGRRFGIMLTLSVVVAVMGLSANSPAVVIGAMLLAPLMQPVLATAACVAMALFRNAIRSFGAVVLATGWAVLLSYLLAVLFVNGELPNEVTSRTAPDIRDLIVALGAGTAGAYATVRKDVSSSLPGVAVAVALVPPLAVIGITVQAGNATLAWGALLLYTTNLFAIMFAGALVFVLTGFVPPRRLATTFRRSSIVAALIGVVVVAAALPLYGASTAAVERSEREVKALDLVSAWLGVTDRRSAPEVSFDDLRITVAVRSFESPPDPGPLVDSLQAAFGEDKIVSIEWDHVDQAIITTTTPTATSILSDEETLYTDIAAIVDQWLLDLGPAAAGHRDLLSVNGNVIRLDASGTRDAPSLRSLTDVLDFELGQTFEVQLTWLKLESVSDPRPPTPDEELADQIDALARAWAEPRAMTVLSTSFDGFLAIIELAGPSAPDATSLVRTVTDLIGPDDRVTVLFVERLDITSTTSTAPINTSTTTSP